MNSKRMLILGAVVIIVALLGVTGVMASGGAAPLRQSGAPGQLNYQGLLLNPTTGDPVPDGDYTLTFAIYDDATSTDPSHTLWQETQTISTQEGLFNVILGTVNSLTTTWLDGRDLWLSITVQGESEMTPRQPLVSVLYALNANDVRGADIHPYNVYASNRVSVGLASDDGVVVNWASDDGVYVIVAGNPTVTGNSSSAHNGFEVVSAEGHGLYVGRADDDGVHVASAGNYAGYFNGDVRVIDQLSVDGPAVGFFPRPTYNSDWQSISPTSWLTLTHNVGGDPDDYFVDMQCRTASLWGINTQGFGGMMAFDGSMGGAYYRSLTSSTVTLYRYSQDGACPQIRVRIWLIR